MPKHLLTLLILMVINPLWADDSYWQCHATDSKGMQWVVSHGYEQVATNKAVEACKKQSPAPESCKALRENCDYSSYGLSMRPLWRCMALDLMSKIWRNNPHPNRDEAAIEAKENCEHHSPMPDTCYINLLTCKNIHENI